MLRLLMLKFLLCGLLAVLVVPAAAQADNVQLQIANLQNADSAIRANAASVLGRFKDPRAIDPLLASLNDPVGTVRMAAALSLSSFRQSRVVPPLTAALKDPDKDVSQAAALSLDILHDPSSIPALISSLSQQRMAVSALTQMAQDSLPALIKALHDEDPNIRAGVAEALGMIRNPAAIPPLLDAMHDPVTEVRISVAIALIGFPDPVAVNASVSAAKDDDPKVREVVVRSLDRLKDPRAFDVLLSATKDPSPAVQLSAYQALGRSNDQRAIPLLTEALNSKDAGIRATASLALSGVRNPKAVPDLVSAYRNSTDRDVRIRALEGLGAQKNPDATELLVLALKDKDFGIRLTAANSLGKIKDARAVKPLVDAISNSDNIDKSPYYGALASIGSPAFEPLAELVNDSRTCPQTAGYLAATHDPRAVPVLLALLNKLDSIPDHPTIGFAGKVSKADLDRAAARAHEVTGTCFFPAARALVGLHESRVIAPLVQSLKTPHSGRDQVPYLLRRLGNPAVEPMLNLLHDPDLETRRLAAQTVSSLVDPRVDAALKAALGERNIPVLAGAYEYYVTLGQPGSEDALVEALQRYGDSGIMEMASYFLNCGNVQLENAARAWNQKRHFNQTQTMYGVIWGGGRQGPRSHQPD